MNVLEKVTKFNLKVGGLSTKDNFMQQIHKLKAIRTFVENCIQQI